ncbi:MAG: helix-turn-helix transcriptional regulator [Clostridia bacterium]|nr:helix-turn-helix transcriptional regulator [Clostridia bacterium]
MENTFARYIHAGDVIFKHAKGMRDVYGLEFHPFHELFLFIDGDAEFISGSFRRKLAKHSLVILPKDSFHHFVVHGPEEDYQRCVLNFNGSPRLQELIEEKMSEICIVSADDETVRLFHKLCAYAQTADPYPKKLLLEAVFVEILLAIDNGKKQGNTDPELSIHPIIKNAVKYINKNAAKIASVKEIAASVNLSPSYFAHLFKRELHISPNKYLLEKKLVTANRMIEDGVGAVNASEACGFANYSAFYKMYKKMFGYPPSKAKKR